MTEALHIDAPVVTGDLLGREHKGERTLRVAPSAILTPTAWDYIRQHRLQLSRGEAVAVSAGVADAGQCDPPLSRGQADRACGCEHEEFGSGYVEPASCGDCAVHQRKQAGDPEASCEGCNRYKTLLQQIEQGQASDPEALVEQITELVIHRLAD